MNLPGLCDDSVAEKFEKVEKEEKAKEEDTEVVDSSGRDAGKEVAEAEVKVVHMRPLSGEMITPGKAMHGPSKENAQKEKEEEARKEKEKEKE